MIWQLRRYRIKPGAMEDFRDLWSNHVVPARRALGFTIGSAWANEETRYFVWFVGHPAPDGWEAVEQNYYKNSGRESWPHQPMEFVEEVIETALLSEEPKV